MATYTSNNANIRYFNFKGAERWGRPHLSSLSFHSLINLRLALEKAVLILDFDHARDFTTIAFKVNKYAIFLILTYLVCFISHALNYFAALGFRLLKNVLVRVSSMTIS